MVVHKIEQIFAWLALVVGVGASPTVTGAADLAGYRIVNRGGQRAVLDKREGLVGTFAAQDQQAVRSEDTIEPAGSGLFRWQRTFWLKPGQAKQRVRLTMDFRANHVSRFAMVPGISWDGNRNDPGNVYKGFVHEGTPWSFAWHRTLIPGATYSEGPAHTVALFGDVGDPRVGLSCSLISGSHDTVHRLIFPEEEMPKRVLIRERGLSPGRANVLSLAPGEKFVATAWLVLHPAERPRLGYRYLLDAAWQHAYRPTAAQRTAEELWTMGVRFAKESLWDADARMFALALKAHGRSRWQHACGFSMGWCGRNGELANGLLADYLKSGDKTSRDMGLACLDAWVERVVPEALAPTRGKTVLPGTERYIDVADDANSPGAVALAFLRAYRLAKYCGADRPQYLHVGRALCDAAIGMQQKDGRFEGAAFKRGAIGGAMLPALLTAYEVTQEVKYRRAAEAAEQYYMGMLYRDGFVWGCALDTRSIDKETIVPLLAGAVRLYDLTKAEQYRTMAEDAAYYLAAWQIAQSILNRPGSLMENIGYETFGGTSVATVHMLADCFGVEAVPYLVQLAGQTGREIWRQRAMALWNHATQGISDGTWELMGQLPRPTGSQDESVNFTDWGYDWLAPGMDRNNPRGAGQCWLVAWPTAMRLTVLADGDLRKRIETWPVQRLPPPAKR